METKMKPNQTCYDRAGRRLTFIAMVGDKALVQSWHLEESVWHEHGHTMEEMAAVEGPIWLEDPAKLYDKPPVVVVNQEMVKAQEALIAAMADLAQKKRDVDAGIREAKARLAAEQRQTARVGQRHIRRQFLSLAPQAVQQPASQHRPTRSVVAGV